MKPLASLTSGELSAAAKHALQVLRYTNLRRAKGCWYGPGAPRITLRVAEQLQARGLARAEISNGRHQLVLTGSGRMLAQVFAERAEQRKRA